MNNISHVSIETFETIYRNCVDIYYENRENKYDSETLYYSSSSGKPSKWFDVLEPFSCLDDDSDKKNEQIFIWILENLEVTSIQLSFSNIIYFSQDGEIRKSQNNNKKEYVVIKKSDKLFYL